MLRFCKNIHTKMFTETLFIVSAVKRMSWISFNNPDRAHGMFSAVEKQVVF